jgi:hypothetical protein
MEARSHALLIFSFIAWRRRRTGCRRGGRAAAVAGVEEESGGGFGVVFGDGETPRARNLNSVLLRVRGGPTPRDVVLWAAGYWGPGGVGNRLQVSVAEKWGQKKRKMGKRREKWGLGQQNLRSWVGRLGSMYHAWMHDMWANLGLSDLVGRMLLSKSWNDVRFFPSC